MAIQPLAAIHSKPYYSIINSSYKTFLDNFLSWHVNGKHNLHTASLF